MSTSLNQAASTNHAAKRHKVVLYNPQAVFYTMPLALIALASYLDPEKYEAVIIDARLEKDPMQRVLDEMKGAVCFGTSVLTGAPIKDALSVTEKVKAFFPDTHVVWGGWHPSLFPEETLKETLADSVVRGQGEKTFAELLERVVAGQSLDGVLGVTWKNGGEIVANGERTMEDINLFPRMNYDFIDVPRYELLSGRKQIDYISSQGCRFRCNFCADPFMYKRGWYGYSASRIADELELLRSKHEFEHVHFQDETFFTSSPRVSQFADEFIKRKFDFTWFGTMRADQGARMPDELFARCKQAGLERVMIGLESGSQRMIDWMKKDIKISQVFETAEKCLRHNIAINFSVIIGFPGELDEDMDETLRVVRELRKMSPEFRVSVFFFKPYPGNEIADQLVAGGYVMPKGIKVWSEFDFVTKGSPWVSKKKYREIENFKFYQRFGWSKPGRLTRYAQSLAKWRCENANYTFPIERILYETLASKEKLS